MVGCGRAGGRVTGEGRDAVGRRRRRRAETVRDGGGGGGMIARRRVDPLRLWLAFFGGRSLGALAAGLFLLLGWWVVGPPDPRTHTEERGGFDEYEVVLTITGKTRRPGPEGMEHRVAYTYRAQDGASRYEEEVLPVESWDLIAIGDRFPATIRDHWTETVTIPGTPDPLAVAARWLLLGGAGGLFVAAAVPVLREGGRARAAVRALRRGEVREARVTGHETMDGRIWRMVWIDAADETGRSMEGAQGDMRPVGSVIVVYADPVTGATWWEEDL